MTIYYHKHGIQNSLHLKEHELKDPWSQSYNLVDII